MNTKNKKSFRSVAADLKRISRRPLTREQIEDLNNTFKKDIEAEDQRIKERKKIAGPTDTDVNC